MAKEYRVNVIDCQGDVVARVRYNTNLDYWNGRNWGNGGTGLHRGLTKLRNGKYVLIHGSDWQGSKDTGEIISKEEALQEILKSGNVELLKTKKFIELKELYDEMIKENEEYEEEEM